MIAIVDYGVGNLFSLESSLSAIGAQSVVTADPEVLKNADQIILPGVGAFGDAVKKLRATGLDKHILALAAAGKPLLGICLGMQLLFEKGFEFGEYDGLGLIKGCVGPLSEVIPTGYKIPHIGWNSIHFTKENPLFSYIKEGDFVYFVHSFCATGCADSVAATTEYGADLTAAVASGNVFGCQFHPEKSGEVGLKILKAFSEMGVSQC
ncbi:MAG: imidazole glycerol phosphate synthase subunit HisH [Oscillospiraceae bacterium]|nr:imidazole glycerol phosphate synthase subunit HisH [Oscillospiraceae bacterium]